MIVRESTDENSEFVSTSSSTGLKLINKQVYEKDLQTNNLTKQEKINALKVAKSKITQQKLAKRASSNRITYQHKDWCNIEGDLFAITKQGAKLVMLNPPVGRKKRTIRWNNELYQRNFYGDLILARKTTVFKDQCLFYQRSGEYLMGAVFKVKQY